MKKSLMPFAFVIFIMTLYLPLHAQFSMGLNMGIGNASYKGETGPNRNFGVISECKISNHIIFHTGLITAIRKTGNEFFDREENRDTYWQANQLFIPVSFKFTEPAEKVGGYVHLGTYLGVLGGTRYPTRGSKPVREPVDFVNYEIGLLAGLGLNIKLPAGNLFIEVQDRFNFNDLTDPEDNYKVHINSLDILNLGVLFYL